MATTGLQAFNLAMALMDEVPSSGVIQEGDVLEYKAKAPYFLTSIQMELASIEGVALPETVEVKTNLDDNLYISDRTARLILPYYLAAQFMLDGDTDIAAFYNQKYEELKRTIPSTPSSIVDVYNVTQGMI